ncbi:hypothetical protein EDB85DRAFT_2228845 [Lactarius pseudohatsudake]|nr:hypothetical protein EDB85DRAFT_2228845 [Lactarius pseudohatsudake]
MGVVWWVLRVATAWHRGGAFTRRGGGEEELAYGEGWRWEPQSGDVDVAWNSPNCGSCWALTNPATGMIINITAIDTAGAGFNIAKAAFDKLAGGENDGDIGEYRATISQRLGMRGV